jgi:hypothetical protein
VGTVAAVFACPAIAAVWSDAAIAAPIDASSDQIALTAYHQYVTALLTGTGTGNRTARQYATAIGAKCPTVLAPLAALPHAQINQFALGAFGEEVGGDLAIAFDTEAVAPAVQLSTTLAHLKWSTRRSRQVVAAMLGALKASLQVRQSDLCADAHALASRPSVEPPGTRVYLASYLPVAALAMRRLTPFLALVSRYQTSTESALIASIASLVTQFNTTSHTDEKALGSALLKALGLR